VKPIKEFWGYYCKASKLHHDKLIEAFDIKFNDGCLSSEDINYKRENRIFFPYLISYFSLCPISSIAGRRETKKIEIEYNQDKKCWEESKTTTKKVADHESN